MKAFTEPLLELSEYRRLLNDIKNKNTPVLVTGVIDVQKTHLAHAVSEHTERPCVIIAPNELRAKAVYESMRFFDSDTLYYTARDVIFSAADVHSNEIVKKRFSVINSLMQNERKTIVMPAQALLGKLMPRAAFERFIINIKEGDTLDMEDFCEKLVYMGYERSAMLEGVGQFAVKGGIIDVYSPVEEYPVRIELWGDEVDSLRLVDILSQRSVERAESVRIFPVRELVCDEKTLAAGIERLEASYKKTRASYKRKGLETELSELQSYVGETIERLKEEKTFPSISNYIGFFCEKPESILDYLSEDTLVLFDEPERVADTLKTTFEEFEESIKSRILGGHMLPAQADMNFSTGEALMRAERLQLLLLSTLVSRAGRFEIKDTVSFTVRSTQSFSQRTELFYDEIKELKSKKTKVLLLGSSQTRCERLVKELAEHGTEAAYVADIASFTPAGGMVAVAKGRLESGFYYPEAAFAVFSDSENGKRDKNARRSLKRRKKAGTIESFTDLKIGDYVVHESHGIGIYRGLESITTENITREYIKISYSDGGNLFIPVSQMDVVQKYIGGEGTRPRLSKLGGQDWGRAKAKARKAVSILADDLVKLYAKRQSASGFVYSKDSVWQKEFEEMFPYEETDDQLLAIEDVKNDMENGRVMDRLICGDVGYGKTEVAIRAAFKAVQDGKQVALLVPTTILAQQHYSTFSSRMASYPVRVEMLSRFKTQKEQKEIIKDIARGYVDIVIGTHRLLSKDVVFKDLGLIIVDEEQRFGVSHKEKLKSLKENSDVLSMTATPIPRTLNMSLSGIKDMSVLEEPPEERHPIQTYVMEYNIDFVRDAVARELARGGQVYYLYNKVSSIPEMAAKIQKLVPDASVAYAHGQMTEHELEEIMKDFIDGDIDVLVCTTIIETGLDIPNVNTIIIHDADHMGLAQLYQLRGRVGRSNRVAFAYLMYRRDKLLPEVAEKRLQTIKEFTAFGSGFKIAMRDLEIRGAGNLLGAEQHGHMEAVGYDMYCRLLNEAVQELKGEAPVKAFETAMDINVNAYIPENYIKNEEERLEIYKKIALIDDRETVLDVADEIIDRFGDMPKPVSVLLAVAELKASAHKADITSVAQKQNSLVAVFKPDAGIDPSVVTKLVLEGKNKYMFTTMPVPYITIRLKDDSERNVLSELEEFLTKLDAQQAVK